GITRRRLVTEPEALELNVDELRPGRYQPRQQLHEASLAELAESIREQGVLQPLIVRIVAAAQRVPGEPRYEIVAGERRWRAARLAGAPAGDAKAAADLQTRWLQEQLARELGEKVSLRPSTNGGYVLKIEFADLVKLEGTLARLTELLGQVRATAGPRARDTGR